MKLRLIFCISVVIIFMTGCVGSLIPSQLYVKNEIPLLGTNLAIKPTNLSDTKLLIFNNSNPALFNDINFPIAGAIAVRLDGRGIVMLKRGEYVQVQVPRGSHLLELTHWDVWTFKSTHQFNASTSEIIAEIWATPLSNDFRLHETLPSRADLPKDFRPHLESMAKMDVSESNRISNLRDRESFTITIPGQRGRIAFDFPRLNEYRGEITDGNRFRFFGAADSNEGSMAISFFVEPFPNGDNVLCRDIYLAKVKSAPRVKQESLKILDKGKYAMTTYLVEGDLKGQHVKATNANFYFINNGSCIDVHVSKYPYKDGDEQIVSKVGESLKWVQESK